jgi:hypothetical protein
MLNTKFPGNEQQLNPSQGPAADADAPWARADKDWFCSHPERRYRARRAFREEIDRPTNSLDRIVVQQLAPGLRARRHFRATCSDNVIAPMRGLVEGAERSEPLAKLLFDLADGGHGDRLISPRKMAKLIRRYVNEGDAMN